MSPGLARVHHPCPRRPLSAGGRSFLIKSESAMVKRVNKRTRGKASAVPRRRRKPEALDEEERILREATKYLVFEHGMFLVATGIREARIKGFRVWIITVTLRYAAGDEGYIGDLLYDGDDFT